MREGLPGTSCSFGTTFASSHGFMGEPRWTASVFQIVPENTLKDLLGLSPQVSSGPVPSL